MIGPFCTFLDLSFRKNLDHSRRKPTWLILRGNLANSRPREREKNSEQETREKEERKKKEGRKKGKKVWFQAGNSVSSRFSDF